VTACFRRSQTLMSLSMPPVNNSLPASAKHIAVMGKSVWMKVTASFVRVSQICAHVSQANSDCFDALTPMYPSSEPLTSISSPRLLTSMQLTTSSCPGCLRILSPVSTSQLAKCISADAEKMTLESRDQCKSNTACLCPVRMP
jgi:hypothetical protein